MKNFTSAQNNAFAYSGSTRIVSFPMADHGRYRRRDPVRELRALAATVVVLVVILAAAWWLTQRRPARQESQIRPNDPVMVEVNGEPIYRSEVRAAIATLPSHLQQQYVSEVGLKVVAEEVVRMKLLEQEARRMGLRDSPEVRGQLEMLESNALASAALQRLVKNAGPLKIEELYEKSKERFETVQLRSIMLPYEGSRAAPSSGRPLSRQAVQARAERLVARIRKGEDFDVVARADAAYSHSDTSEVGRGNMPRGLEDVVFSLPVGKVSDPVQSPFGIHIFQVIERKVAPLEQVRPILEQEGNTFAANAIIEELRKNAKVEFKRPFRG